MMIAFCVTVVLDHRGGCITSANSSLESRLVNDDTVIWWPHLARRKRIDLGNISKIAVMKEFRKQRVLFPKGKKIQHACCFDLVIRITHEHTNLTAVV